MFIHNENSGEGPKFRAGVSIESFSNYPSKENPWSLTEALSHIKNAGFDCIETWCSPDEFAELSEVAKAAKDEGLAVGGFFRTESTEELRQCLMNMKRVGGDYLSIHLAKLNRSNITPINAGELIEEMYDIAASVGIPLFMETHRDTALQDIYQTMNLLQNSKRLCLNFDLSHYVLAGECNDTNREEWLRDITPLLSRGGTFHGRISNGSQIQIGLGEHETVWRDFFIEMWSEAMYQWIKQALPGDVCNFICELLGPPYALTMVKDGREVEMFDRWEQTLLLKTYADKAWDSANQSFTKHRGMV